MNLVYRWKVWNIYVWWTLNRILKGGYNEVCLIWTLCLVSLDGDCPSLGSLSVSESLLILCTVLVLAVTELIVLLNWSQRY